MLKDAIKKSIQKNGEWTNNTNKTVIVNLFEGSDMSDFYIIKPNEKLDIPSGDFITSAFKVDDDSLVVLHFPDECQSCAMSLYLQGKSPEYFISEPIRFRDLDGIDFVEEFYKVHE